MSKKASQASIQALAVLDELKRGITDIVEHHKDSQIPLSETASVASVCFTVEKILHIGLKDIAIFGTTTVWDYLIEVKDCLPGGEKLVDTIKELQKTDMGRARAFIRIGLNEQSLSSFLEALVWNRDLTAKYYSKESLLCSEEYATMIFLLLESIKTVPFKLRVDDPLLGHLHYWDLMARSAVQMKAAPSPTKKPSPAPQPPHAQPVPPQPSSSNQHPFPHQNSPNTTPQGPPRVQQPPPTTPVAPLAASTAVSTPSITPAASSPPVNASPSSTSVSSPSGNPFDDFEPTAVTTPVAAQPTAPDVLPNQDSATNTPNGHTEPLYKGPMPSLLVTRPNGLGPGYATAPTPETTAPPQQTHVPEMAPLSPTPVSTEPTHKLVLPQPGDLRPDSPIGILDLSDTTELTPRIDDSKSSTDVSPAVSRGPSLSASPYTPMDHHRISVGQSPAPIQNMPNVPTASALLSSAEWAEMGQGVETLLQQTVDSLNQAQTRGLISSSALPHANATTTPSSSSSSNITVTTIPVSNPTPIVRSDSSTDHRARVEEIREMPAIANTPSISSSPKIDEMERSLLRAPFASEFDDESRLHLQTPPNYSRVLYTPPGSGRVPLGAAPVPLTPSSSVVGPSALGLSSGDILGTTPSQADLPSLIASLKQQPDVSSAHRRLLTALKDAIAGLSGTTELVTLKSSAARETLDAIEGVLLDNFVHIESWDSKYAALWNWLASAPPSLPHITQILHPLTHFGPAPKPSAVMLCRAFLDAAINRKCLDSILPSLVKESTRNSSPLRLDSRALLANDHLSSLFFKLIQELKQYNFDLSESPVEFQFSGAIAPVEPQVEIPERPILPEPVSPQATPSLTASTDPAPSAPEQRPPSFKKRKKLATIQDAPPTPQPKKSNKKDDEFSPTTDSPLDSSPPTIAPLNHREIAAQHARHTIDSSSSSGSPAMASNVPLGGAWREVHTFTDARRVSPKGSLEAESSLGKTSLGSKDLLSKSPKGSSSMKLPPSPSDNPIIRPTPIVPSTANGSSGYVELRSQLHDSYVHRISSSPMTPYDFSSDIRTAPAAYAQGNGSSAAPGTASSSSSQRLSSSPGGHPKRTRSFSGGAPDWALEIQQFPAGSYKPNTDWLGAYSDEEEFDDWDRSITASPTMGVSSLASSSSSPPSSSPSLPHRLLNADVITEYKPATKKSIIRRTGFPSATEKDVVKVRQPDGEEALEVDSQLYKNSKPAEFFILEMVKRAELTAKNSLCSGCGEDLTNTNARWCAYSGNYYCPKCHTNKASILPARVIKQWNFKTAKVSDWAYDYLKENWNRPVLDVAGLLAAASTNERTRSLVNVLPLPIPLSLPRLPLTGKKSAPVSVIIHLSSQRERLVSVAEFIRSCRNGQRLLANLTDRLHLLWSSTLWSMQDLVDARNGKLEPILDRSLAVYSSHVRSCDTCSGKGFVCEICTSKDVIYPFDTKTASCPNCKALFHESCWKSNPGKCPKCVRVKSIRKRENPM